MYSEFIFQLETNNPMGYAFQSYQVKPDVGRQNLILLILKSSMEYKAKMDNTIKSYLQKIQISVILKIGCVGHIEGWVAGTEY